jgi:DNA mismatch repair protein MutS2
VDPWSAELLEFEELRELLCRFVPSPLGRRRLDAVEPLTDRGAIEALHEETAEAIAYLDSARSAKAGAPQRLRFSDLPDIEASAAKIRIEGAVLDGKELYDLGVVLDRAMEVRTALSASGPRLRARIAPIPDLRPALRELEGKLLPDGSVADDASVALARLRRDRLRQQQAIQESLDRFVKAHRDDGLLQENFITVRNDRFVVPVVAGQRRRVEGVIHGASGTGQTLFVEPLETIELNNSLVRITEEEAREVHRILRELTAVMREAGPGLTGSIAILGEIEWIFGRADFALQYDCALPVLCPENGPRRIEIRAARHPLLAALLRTQRKPIVPVSIELEEPVRTLLITGPNTGGKTVAMKTAGLFALMTQSGIPLPAASARLPLFEQVLADVGDNQSIAESLSSFSAHARRLGEILEAATRHSLVLLDELGRATDPEEGGALGVALIDELRQTGCFTLASTHLAALKVYGASTGGVLNGSMGFDEETLKPTYVLRTGAPGRSAGLAIASQLGLPERLIAKAREAMSHQERDLVRLIGELNNQVERLEQERAALARQTAELNDRRQRLEQDYDRRRAELERKIDQLVASLESRTRTAVEEVKAAAQSRKAADQAQLAASRAQRELRQEAQTVLSKDSPPSARTPEVLKLEPGVRVRLEGIRELARVRRVLADTIEVEVGFLRMQLPSTDVREILPPGETAAKLPKNVSFAAGPSWTVSQRELNVIGKTADEAREEIDRFLDKAALASIDRVRIVHGHGMGILKRAVADLLSAHPHIDRFEPEHGATVAWLRS